MPVMSRYNNLLKKAMESASSWGENELANKYKEEKNQLTLILEKAKSSLWGINAEVHFNEWSSMTQKDFKAVRDVYFKLDRMMLCSECGTRLALVDARSEVLKCDCGVRNYNLKKKRSPKV